MAVSFFCLFVRNSWKAQDTDRLTLNLNRFGGKVLLGSLWTQNNHLILLLSLFIGLLKLLLCDLVGGLPRQFPLHAVAHGNNGQRFGRLRRVLPE